MSRSSSGRLPSRSSSRRWPGSAEQWPTSAVVERGRVGHHQRQHRRRDDVAVEHDRQRSVAGGDDGGRDRHQLGAADLAEHLDRVGDTGDAPHGGLHGDPLAAEALVVDARCRGRPRPRSRRRPARRRSRPTAVVLPMPISPSTSRSPSSASTARDGGRHHGIEPLVVDSAASKRMSPVGRPMPTSTAVDGGAGQPGERVDRRPPLLVGGEHRRGDLGRVRADRLGRGHAVIGGEDQRRPVGGSAGRSVRCQPGHPRRDLVEPGQRTARAAGSRPPARARRPRPPRRGRAGRRGRSCSHVGRQEAPRIVEPERPPGDEQQRTVGAGGHRSG